MDSKSLAVAIGFLSATCLYASPSAAAVVTLRCDGGEYTKVDHGQTSTGVSNLTTYFGYSDDYMMMMFSPDPNDPRDLSVHRGLDGQEIDNGQREITFTLTDMDSFNQWQIDKTTHHVRWSLIGNPNDTLSGVSTTFDFDCHVISR